MTVLEKTPRLSGIDLHFRLADKRGLLSPLADTVHVEPLSINLAYLLESACAKFASALARRLPFVANPEVKVVRVHISIFITMSHLQLSHRLFVKNLDAMFSHADSIATSLCDILTKPKNLSLAAEADRDGAFEVTHFGFVAHWRVSQLYTKQIFQSMPEYYRLESRQRKRGRASVEHVSRENEANQMSLRPAQLPMRFVLLHLACHGLALRAPKVTTIAVTFLIIDLDHSF